MNSDKSYKELSAHWAQKDARAATKDPGSSQTSDYLHRYGSSSSAIDHRRGYRPPPGLYPNSVSVINPRLFRPHHSIACNLRLVAQRHIFRSDFGKGTDCQRKINLNPRQAEGKIRIRGRKKSGISLPDTKKKTLRHLLYGPGSSRTSLRSSIDRRCG
jgi:hypothetical protein